MPQHTHTQYVKVPLSDLQLEAKLEVERKEHQLKTAHMESLKQLGVDMTRYLVARQPQFGPEKEVIVGKPASTTPWPSHSSV